MDDLRYPDNGELLEDASILRNAFEYATAQRAFTAYNLLRQPLENLRQDALAFFAAEAFMLEMTATEDLLAWLFAFRAWNPGEVKTSLWPLLHTVQVGRGDYSEDDGAALLKGLDATGFRQLMHIPTDSELQKTDMPADVRDRINRAVPANLEGYKRLISHRQASNRLRVRAFNKLKHQFLALRADNSAEVIIPIWEEYDERAHAIRMATFKITCSPSPVRLMASRSIIAQATLNSLIGIVLWTRYDDVHDSPGWVIGAMNLEGWRGDHA